MGEMEKMDAQFMLNVPFFAGLNEKEYELLGSLFIEKNIKKGGHIFLEGDVGTEFYLIKQGRVKIYRITNGKESILSLLNNGDYFGEMAMLDPNNSRSAAAVALENTTLFILKENEWKSLLMRNPQLLIKLLSLTMEKLRRANDKIQHLTFFDVRTRVYKLIVQLAKDYGIHTEDGLLINYKLTHQQMADLIGAVRETVSKIMAELQQEEWITLQNKKILIKDMANFEEGIIED